jgi:hypothetical protein
MKTFGKFISTLPRYSARQHRVLIIFIYRNLRTIRQVLDMGDLRQSNIYQPVILPPYILDVNSLLVKRN